MLNSRDEEIVKIIKQKINDDETFWDFKNDYHKDHIHSILQYPATMVPRMQAELIDIIMSLDDDINSIFDPFMGSGTILVEGMLRNLHIAGIDINPLAYLVTTVKTTPVSVEKLRMKITALFEKLERRSNFDIITFPYINKWYKNEIIENLSRIRSAIVNEPDIEYRRLFWVSFCEIARIACNSQKSTFKLHIKELSDIDNFDLDCMQSFKDHILTVASKMEEYIDKLDQNLSRRSNTIKYKKTTKILLGNSLKLMNDKRRFKDDSIDLIATSPPYGDNHTTVTYGQYSILQLRWIDKKDIGVEFDESILDTNSGIDRKSLGGINYTFEDIEASKILDKSPTLNSIHENLISNKRPDKARKVVSFYIDFFKALESCFRILKQDKYAIFTVGNRRVHNNVIEFNKIIAELVSAINGQLVYDFKRNIHKKRIPSRISKLENNESVKSIKEENIVIFRKL